MSGNLRLGGILSSLLLSILLLAAGCGSTSGGEATPAASAPQAIATSPTIVPIQKPSGVLLREGLLGVEMYVPGTSADWGEGMTQSYKDGDVTFISTNDQRLRVFVFRAKSTSVQNATEFASDLAQSMDPLVGLNQEGFLGQPATRVEGVLSIPPDDEEYHVIVYIFDMGEHTYQVGAGAKPEEWNFGGNDDVTSILDSAELSSPTETAPTTTPTSKAQPKSTPTTKATPTAEATTKPSVEPTPMPAEETPELASWLGKDFSDQENYR